MASETGYGNGMGGLDAGRGRARDGIVGRDPALFEVEAHR